MMKRAKMARRLQGSMPPRSGGSVKRTGPVALSSQMIAQSSAALPGRAKSR
jgi:hypothetical protein